MVCLSAYTSASALAYALAKLFRRDGVLTVLGGPEFMNRLPRVRPNLNIPTPFGGTPLFDRYVLEGRILRSMPFAFYYTPYLVTTLRSYTAVEYYGHLIDLFLHLTSRETVARRGARPVRSRGHSAHHESLRRGDHGEIQADAAEAPA